MAQTIWIHKLSDAKKAEADGMEYICEHLLTQSGKLTKVKGWNPFENASAKDGTTYRALFCDSCGKNYKQRQRENGERARAGIRKPLLTGLTPDKWIIALVALVDKLAQHLADLA